MTKRVVETERLTLAGLEVDVRRRPYKRSIGLTLQVNGRIRVSAPKSTPVSRIEEFLLANTKWIESTLRKYQQVRSAFPPKQYVLGEEFPYLGRKLKLRFVLSRLSRVSFSIAGDELIAHIPKVMWLEKFSSGSGLQAPDLHHAAVAIPDLAESLGDFYAREARRILTERLAHWSERMQLRPSALSFRSQKTRWGSCTVHGKISLNWRLIVAPVEVIDYVLVHELAHLRHHNHSVNFWHLVATQIPNFDQHRQWLRDQQFEGDFLARRSELHD